MKSLPFRSSAVIAAVYGYFLIFAQFAFVELMRSDFHRRIPSAGMTQGTEEKVVLAAMAVAGIAAGFFAAWKGATPGKVRLGLILAAIASALAPYTHGTVAFISLGIITGISIGLATVSLAPLVRSWGGLPSVGLGTGLGYALCNLPFVFSQSPAHQTWIASTFALIGAACVPTRADVDHPQPAKVFPFPAALLMFTALVWLDSAAFFIIQHVPDFKAGTWGDGSLWRNTGIHLSAAIAAGWWLKRESSRMLPAAAWVILALAAMSVNHYSLRPFCGLLYPAAVSLYSTALVAWPAWFSGATDRRTIAWRAAWLYAVAGWFGSANGIGMAQSLKRVPQEFIIISGMCVAGVLLISHMRYWRPAIVIAIVAAPAILPAKKEEATGQSGFERGKQVYLSEGCIHCHSQYVRPDTLDVERWGPAPDKVPASRPVLIGNRRQGPDLSNIGIRRSPTWLKQHFIDPRAFSPGSPMPSYAHLFKDVRGDDLVTYLSGSGEGNVASLIAKSASWVPSTITPSGDARALFASQCAVCHGEDGRGHGKLSGAFPKPPADLINGPFIWSPPTPYKSLKLARIIKFGIPGTDMPGHETLSDAQILALRDHVIGIRRKTE